ncbi:hypothetical protein E2C01_093421 [Portunus trituberculatus]|uniref:Uncharacterized protein n=1 Tax=Portunus trituberculatus TaxID=210409 RepID=A0A5B7JIW8_PORTR|nr:hypothetical protein [Portunus trituberculatus]
MPYHHHLISTPHEAGQDSSPPYHTRAVAVLRDPGHTVASCHAPRTPLLPITSQDARAASQL